MQLEQKLINQVDKLNFHQNVMFAIHISVDESHRLISFLANILDVDIVNHNEIVFANMRLFVHEAKDMQAPNEIHLYGFSEDELKNILSRAEFYYFREASSWPAALEFQIPKLCESDKKLLWKDWHQHLWVFNS